MAFRVEISPQALGDLDEIADYIKASASFEAAQRWFNGIIDDIRSLREMPSRCARADQLGEIGADVRVLLHGKRNRRYKVYFAIHRETHTVHVFHVRHWAREPLSEDALEDLIGRS